MKNLFIILFFAIIDAIPGSKIAMVNEYKSQAEIAMRENNYEQAIESYSFLVDSLGLEDEGLKLNLANAYYLDFKKATEELESKANGSNIEEDKKTVTERMENIKKMTPIYEILCRSSNKIIRGRANNQAGNLAMGAIPVVPASYKDAVPLFKEALKAEPMNEEYRYNYELAKKLAEDEKKKEEKKDKNKDEDKEDKKEEEKKNEEEKKKEEEQKKEGDKKEEEKKGEEEKKNEQEKKDADKDKEGKEGEEKDNKEEGEKGEEKSKEKKEGEKEGEKGEKEGATGKDGEKTDEQKKEEIKKAMQKRLQNINMTDEKAKMILNAMKNQEKQYYQQMQRGKKKKKDKSKPDW